MRKLGNGHSLVFLASDEVTTLIEEANRCHIDEISSKEVLIWTIRETWKQLQSQLTTFAEQGVTFLQREAAWNQMSENMITARELAELNCEPHAYTVAELYGPASSTKPEWLRQLQSLAVDNSMAQKILDRIEEFDLPSLSFGKETEDMEVELMHETEVQWSTERPPEAIPAKHKKNEAVNELLVTGNRPNISSGIGRADCALLGTSLKLPAGFQQVFEHLYVTEDFCRTIESPEVRGDGYMDEFLRPLEWLITPNVPNPQFIVALSPFEVNENYELIRNSTKVRLHCFAPRYMQSMRTFEDLKSFSLPSQPAPIAIPQELAHLINLYSGSLFIRDYQAYQHLCILLRLSFDPAGVEQFGTTSGGNRIIDASFFVLDQGTRSRLGMTGHGFEESPVSCLKKLFVLRRHGRGLGLSHMGKLLHGVKLQESDFDENEA
jgi:hypothetical protein